MKQLVILVLVFSLFSLIFGQSRKGTIKGKVIDQNTKETLVGANVLIQNTSIGASADANGEYVIENLPVGTYSIRFSFIGYETVIKTDIQVKPGRITFTDAELSQSIIQSEEISVTSGYFQSNDISELNAAAFNAEEIKRSPGSMGDVSRILMAMPSTAQVSDDNNDLAVRGGSPTENGFYVDGIPIPNINHFPSIGSTGGPNGILNIDFIDNVNFLTSGLSPKYGDRLSSIIDINFREGNRERFEMQADLNISGFGGGAEGPLGSNGSWMISGKRSYLDLVMDMFFDSGVMPLLDDVQGKVVYNLGKKHKLSLLDIFAHNSEDYNRDDAIDLETDEYGSIENIQNTAGFSWRALWSNNFYSVTSISHSFTTYKNKLYRVSDSLLDYDGKNLEQLYDFRNINYLQLGLRHKMEFGLEVKHESGSYDYTQTSNTTELGTVNPGLVLDTDINSSKYSAFLNYILQPFNRLTLSTGLRTEHYSLNDKAALSPRFAISYDFSNLFMIYANGGIFYQQLPMYLLSQKKEFEKLDNVKAVHYGFGVECLLSPDTKLTIELYDKEYSKLPLDKTDPSQSIIDEGLSINDFGNYTSLVSAGKAYTRGVELMLQKKLAGGFYGMVSSSVFRNRYRGYNGKWYDRTYDNKFIFNILGGYKPNKEWEFSIRWTYAGGRPYTPLDIQQSAAANRGIINQSRINAERLPAYHSLNLRIDKKFYFSSQSIDIYLSIWNVYNRENINGYSWDTDKNKVRPDKQWGILPLIGIEYEL